MSDETSPLNAQLKITDRCKQVTVASTNIKGNYIINLEQKLDQFFKPFFYETKQTLIKGWCYPTGEGDI